MLDSTAEDIKILLNKIRTDGTSNKIDKLLRFLTTQKKKLE